LALGDVTFDNLYNTDILLLLSLLGILIPTALNTLTFRQAQDSPEHVAKVQKNKADSKRISLM
jgi:hypothetical protein